MELEHGEITWSAVVNVRMIFFILGDLEKLEEGVEVSHPPLPPMMRMGAPLVAVEARFLLDISHAVGVGLHHGEHLEDGALEHLDIGVENQSKVRFYVLDSGVHPASMADIITERKDASRHRGEACGVGGARIPRIRAVDYHDPQLRVKTAHAPVGALKLSPRVVANCEARDLFYAHRKYVLYFPTVSA